MLIYRRTVARRLVAVATLFCLTAFLLGQTEPRSIHQMFDDLTSVDPETKERAKKAFSSLGDQLPEYEPHRLRKEILPIIFDRLDDDEIEVKGMAVMMLLTLSGSLEIERKKSLRNDAGVVFPRIKEEISSDIAFYLKALLEDPAPPVRHSTLWAISFHMHEPEMFKDRLLEFLQDPDIETRKFAAAALSKIEPLPADVISRFLAMLESEPNATIRGFTAQFLGEAKLIREDIISALIDRLQKDPNRFVRSKAAYGLGRIGLAAAAAIPALEKMADNPDEKEIDRRQALSALKSIRGY